MQTHFYNNALFTRESVLYQFYEKVRDVDKDAVKLVARHYYKYSSVALNEIHRLMSNASIQFKGWTELSNRPQLFKAWIVKSTE